ncbi:MAG: hypothetical protein RIR26_2537 [Pseudomonadota bacterium]
MKLRMYGATDKGLVRALNQDAYACDASTGVVILSDGMGGHAAGEVASQMVVEGLAESLSQISQVDLQEIAYKIDEAIQSVNTKLLVKSQEDASCRGMGATVNVLCFSQGFVTIGHVGDSRTYLLRAYKSPDDKPRFSSWQLTIDHNLGTFLDRGIVNVTGTKTPPSNISPRDRSKLTRGMGVMADPKPDIYTKRLTDGDVFLTCSDGLHGFVSDRDVLKTLISGPLAEAPQRMIDIAKAAGAPDNVTIILTVVSDLEEPFREFKGPVFTSRPFLLRLPTGEVQGPLTSSEIIELWLKRSLPGNTEMAAGLGDWVLLRNKDSVVQTYSEFKQNSYLNHVYIESNEELPEPPVSSYPVSSTTPQKKKSKALVWSFLVLVLLSLALGSLIIPEIPSILLPAY